MEMPSLPVSLRPSGVACPGPFPPSCTPQSSGFPRCLSVRDPDVGLPSAPKGWEGQQQVELISESRKPRPPPPLTSAKKALSWSRCWKMLGELVSRRVRRWAASSEESRAGCGSCGRVAS